MAKVKILMATNVSMLVVQSELSQKEILIAQELNPALLTIVEKNENKTVTKFRVSVEGKYQGDASKYGVSFEAKGSAKAKLSLMVPISEGTLKPVLKATAASIQTNLGLIEKQVKEALEKVNGVEIETEDFSSEELATEEAATEEGGE